MILTSKIKYKIANRWCTLFWVTWYANGRTLKYELELVFLFHKDRAILIGYPKIQMIYYEAQIEWVCRVMDILLKMYIVK